MCLLLASATLLSAPLKKEVFRVEGGERFSIELPPEWKVDTQVAAGAPIETLRVVSTEGTSILMLSVMPSVSTVGDSLAELEQILVSGSRRMARDSVEKAVRPLSFRSPYATGVYATFTDARYVNVEPPKGEYRFSTTFILSCSRRVVTATFLSAESSQDVLELVVLILKTLRKEVVQS